MTHLKLKWSEEKKNLKYPNMIDVFLVRVFYLALRPEVQESEFYFLSLPYCFLFKYFQLINNKTWDF